MIRNLTSAQLSHAATVVAAWLACSPNDLTIEPATGGRSTPVFRVQLANRSCYLRLTQSSAATNPPYANHIVAGMKRLANAPQP